MLVTGHNLDDEVATLFGNVLHWNTDMLGRQAPVLEERVLEDGSDGRVALVRKVKPLVRIAERETAAHRFSEGPGETQLRACSRCGSATVTWDDHPEPVCSFCKTKDLATRRKVAR